MLATASDTLISLIYVSSATILLSHEELTSLLETSRRNNTRAGITGMLLYKDGNFMQVIEGPAAEIYRLHERIAHDARHGGLITLSEMAITQRQFSEWSMGFRNLSDSCLRGISGYSEFLNTPLTDTQFVPHSSRAMRLLSVFKANM